MMKRKKDKRERRRGKIRARVKGSKDCLRIVVFRANKHIYAQVVDDEKGKVIASSSDLKLDEKLKKSEKAGKVGSELGEKLKKMGVKEAVFDRAGYKYHGRVKALCEAIRKEGIKI